MTKGINNKDRKPVAFGDMCRNLNESESNPLANGIDRYVGLEHIETNNLHLTSWGNVADGTTFTKRFRKGQVLFGKRRAYLRKAAIADFDGICSGDILVFEANEKVIDSNLLPFIVSSDKFFDYAVQTSAGSLSPRTKFQDLAKLKFLLPPKDQQAKIAKLLWAADEVVEKLTSISSTLDITKKRFETNELYKFNDENSKIPDAYKIRKLEEVAEITGGSTPHRNNPLFWAGDIPWLTPTDVTKHSKILISQTKECISESGLKSISNRLYPPGSILYCSRASIGAAVINEVPMATNQGFSNFICKSSEVSNYFLYFLLRHCLSELLSVAGGSTFPEISKSSMRSFKVLIPPLNVQDKIVSKILQIENEEKSNRDRIMETKEIQKQLINQIFS